jgi:predicted nucleic acid-binding Zn ribbon protein
MGELLPLCPLWAYRFESCTFRKFLWYYLLENEVSERYKIMKEILERLERKIGLGPRGKCKCPECGEEVKHETGVSCDSIRCPKCGTSMRRVVREE